METIISPQPTRFRFILCLAICLGVTWEVPAFAEVKFADPRLEFVSNAGKIT